MKYYTSELWLEAGDPDADMKWKANSAAYSEVFDTIKKRLPKNFMKIFFSNAGFHDFRLLNIGLAQAAHSRKNPVLVHLDIQSYPDIRYPDKVLRISYKYPVKFEVKYNKDIDRYGFDDWGYCEFLPVDEQTLSHEILFVSGATILIHFKDKNISVEELSS